MSLVSGSQVSGAPAKKKRGRKSKAERASEAAAEALREGTPSVVGGRAPTVLSTASGNNAGKDGEGDTRKEEEFEIPENMASMSAARTKEQIEEDKELQALLKSQMTPEQFSRYEVWHRQTLKNADVKRVRRRILCRQFCANVIANYIRVAHQQRHFSVLSAQRSSDDASGLQDVPRRHS